MKNRQIFVVAVLLLGGASVGAQQKYHDAVVQDAYGPVKMIKTADEEYLYDVEGRLVSINGKRVAETTEYSDDGYPLERCLEQCITYEYEGNKLVMEIYDTLLGATYYTYEYNSKGVRISQLAFNGMFSLGHEYYRILRYDDKGNWVEREVVFLSDNSESDTSDDVPSKKESRVIVYYDDADLSVVRKAEYAKYMEKSFPLTTQIMLERPLGVVNTCEITYPVLCGIVRTNPDMFSNVQIKKNFMNCPSLFANVRFPYKDYTIDYVSVTCIDETTASVRDLTFHVKVPSKSVKDVAKQMCKDLEALGIEMKKHKWDIFAGYRGYQGNNTVSVMYETDDPTGVSLLVTLGERLK